MQLHHDNRSASFIKMVRGSQVKKVGLLKRLKIFEPSPETFDAKAATHLGRKAR